MLQWTSRAGRFCCPSSGIPARSMLQSCSTSLGSLLANPRACFCWLEFLGMTALAPGWRRALLRQKLREAGSCRWPQACTGGMLQPSTASLGACTAWRTPGAGQTTRSFLRSFSQPRLAAAVQWHTFLGGFWAPRRNNLTYSNRVQRSLQFWFMFKFVISSYKVKVKAKA